MPFVLVKILFLKELLSTEIILTRGLIYTLMFLVSLITIVLLSYDEGKIEIIFNKLDKIPLGFILKKFLSRVMIGSQAFKILWIYFTLFSSIFFSYSLLVGLLKAYAVLI